MRTLTRALLVTSLLTVTALATVQAAIAQPAAGDPPASANQGLRVSRTDDRAIGDVLFDPAASGQPAGSDDAIADTTRDSRAQDEGPRCWYEPLKFTTQEEQRTDIRPWEQRPGRWGWQVCDDGTQEFAFFPDVPDDSGDAPVDPAALADSVEISPQVPTIHTSPPPDALHLVNLETWFWVDGADWGAVSGDATAGPVSVTVTARPATLVVDPGDGSPPIQCPGGGTPYDTDLPADAQHSDCTHTYTAPGDYTPTATVVYDVSWTSNVAPGGDLGDITPTAQPFTLQVVEGQAVVVSGTGR